MRYRCECTVDEILEKKGCTCGFLERVSCTSESASSVSKKPELPKYIVEWFDSIPVLTDEEKEKLATAIREFDEEDKQNKRI